MQIHQKANGRYVAATFLPTKKRFRTTLTKDHIPHEFSSVEDISRDYKSIESVARALRKLKATKNPAG